MNRNENNSDTARDLLRHSIATLAYRGRKAITGVPEGFSAFRAGPTTRTPGEILAHIGDLLDWAWHLAQGVSVWQEVAPQSWEADTARFFKGLQTLDDYLASEAVLAKPAEKIFQGPLADALTHVGQINLLRRLAEAPVRGENYFRADVVTGRVGPAQTAPKFEFD